MKTLRYLPTLIVVGMLVRLAFTSAVAQPTIPASQPTDQTNIVGSTATFSVTANGTPPLTNQWRYYSSATTFTNIPSETNATLLLTNVQPVVGRFAVVVSDSTGARLSRLAKLTVNVPPSITTQPASQTVLAGSTVTFSLVATGTPVPSVQWRFNGADLPGRTGTTLTLANVQPANSGEYTVWVTNSVGSILSDPAILTVRVPDVIYQWDVTGFTALDTLGGSRHPPPAGHHDDACRAV